MKFMILALFAIIVVANAKVVISLDDMLKAYEETNDIGDNALGANPALYIPMTLKDCNNDTCNRMCQSLGYNHGHCVSCNRCKCYNN